MPNTLEFEYEGFAVTINYDSSTQSLERSVFDAGEIIYQDELQFDKSLVNEFEFMSEKERTKIATAWGAAAIKTRIEDGQFGAKTK